MTVLITITAPGVDLDLFDLYSDLDDFAVPFETDITKAALQAGYLSSLVPDFTISIRIKSKNACNTEVTVDLADFIPPTSSTSSTSSTSTSSTTANPNCYDYSYKVLEEDLTKADDGKVYMHYADCEGNYILSNFEFPEENFFCADQTFYVQQFIKVSGVDTPTTSQPVKGFACGTISGSTTSSTTTAAPVICNTITYDVQPSDLSGAADGKVYLRYKLCSGAIVTEIFDTPLFEATECVDYSYTPILYTLVGVTETPVANQPTVGDICT